MSDLEAIVAAVASSKKYRDVCPDTVRRIAEGEVAKRGNVKEAVKATKRRLHQVYGAFESASDYDAAYERLAVAYATGAEEQIRTACREVLARHNSTRERLPILDRFYPALWQITGRPDSILDLGCGLNPLALPWMDLDPGARYVALDIDAARIEFVNRYLALAGREPLARCQDILAHPPQDEADPSASSGPGVALLLKMSPSLELQQAGATLHLLELIRAPFVVVSFAVKSLGGREKGMLEHYRRQFSGWVEGRPWAVEQLTLETELVFVVGKQRISGMNGSKNP
jgi:16S rRNA (guanine(1405)-N(7))-methyltransferase